MSFIQRELDRISRALHEPRSAEYNRLYAAQQALAWALEPTGFQSPYDVIKDTLAISKDCPPLSNQERSSDNPESDV